MTAGHRPTLIVLASPRAWIEPTGTLLRLVRDHTATLKLFQIHTTRRTGNAILATGLYSRQDVERHPSGRDGGVAELAAIVARGESRAAILLLDPSDAWSDAVENRALKRVCIQLRVRLISTYAAATHWLEHEADQHLAESVEARQAPKHWRPQNWEPGDRNVTEPIDSHNREVIPLEIGRRSVALISHDKKKLEMIQFVNKHSAILANHHRIITTGTTGWLLKLLFADESQQVQLEQDIQANEKGHARILCVLDELLLTYERSPRRKDLHTMISMLRKEAVISANRDFTGKVMPLPSGPAGGDVLIANEVLDNRCHSLVFFHDPETAHPHNDDIRLLERTCQIPGVFAECISDSQSADRWVEGLKHELDNRSHPSSPAQELRNRLRLTDVVLVETADDIEGLELGRALARATAGFFHHRLAQLVTEKSEIRVGVAWGWGTATVLEELQQLHKDALVSPLPPHSCKITWSPLIGIIMALAAQDEAAMLAEQFRALYGGEVEAFAVAGFAERDAVVPQHAERLIGRLKESDIVLTSASAWNQENGLDRKTGLKRDKLPDFDKAVGLVSGIFLDSEGLPVSHGYRLIGLDHEGFAEAARRGAVILMCGGVERHCVLEAVLRGGLASVVVTSHLTAKWVLDRHWTMPGLNRRQSVVASSVVSSEVAS